MALWRPKGLSAQSSYRKRLLKEKNSDLVLHNSFFISDQGGTSGAKIDYVERRQAARRKRPCREGDTR